MIYAAIVMSFCFSNYIYRKYFARTIENVSYAVLQLHLKNFIEHQISLS